MTNSTQPGTKTRAEREADARAARRAEQASIVAGLQGILEPNEQLLGFARGRIAGGFRGKLNVGPEAFFAPFVNIGLTERRFVLQHIHPENGRPSEILPHFFPLADIASVTFSDIETFGAEPACRLVMHLHNDLYCRLRLRGALNFENARALAEVFSSLTASQRSEVTPTQRTCSQCGQVLDQPYRFCPYCGQRQPETQSEPSSIAADIPAPVEATPEDEAAIEAEVEQAAADSVVVEDAVTAEMPYEQAQSAPKERIAEELPGMPEATQVGAAAESPFQFAEPTPSVPPENEAEASMEAPAVWPDHPLAQDEAQANVPAEDVPSSAADPERIAAAELESEWVGDINEASDTDEVVGDERVSGTPAPESAKGQHNDAPAQGEN